MSTGRVLWIIWCLFWAGSWLVLAVASLITLIGPVICLGLAALSLLAILLPVGTQPSALAQSVCPLCGGSRGRGAAGGALAGRARPGPDVRPARPGRTAGATAGNRAAAVRPGPAGPPAIRAAAGAVSPVPSAAGYRASISRVMMAGMALPQHPARVRLTLKDGTVRWLADRPYARMDEPGEPGTAGWRLVAEEEAAGVFPWQRALVLARDADQRWRQQYAVPVAVAERSAVGDDARQLAGGMGLDDPAAVRCLVFGPGRVLVLRSGDRRELLPAIAKVAG